MRKLLARTAEEGSRNLLQAAFAGPESHGTYCSECKVKEYVLSPVTLFAGQIRLQNVTNRPGNWYVPIIMA
jgi:hypothetical protein